MAVIGLRNLCTPAQIYLLLSMAAILMIGLQTSMSGGSSNYCVGMFSCSTVNVISLFAVKILFILVWTWILNIICKNGNETVSWILVLIPIVLMFIFIAMTFMTHFDIDKYMPSVGLN